MKTAKTAVEVRCDNKKQPLHGDCKSEWQVAQCYNVALLTLYRTMKHFDPLQELDTSPDSEFIKAIEFVVQEKIPATYILESVPLGVTPLVLQLCDIELVNMRTTYGTIEKVISEFINRPNDDKRYQRIHNINPEDLKKLPIFLCNPIAVIQSQTVAKNPYDKDNKHNKPNGLVILVELTETKKSQHKDWLAPSIVAVHYNYQKRNLNITSVYGKPMGFWIENLSSNLLMYLNRPKCRQFLNTFLTPEVRRKLNSKEDGERIQIIREICDTEIHKDRSLNTRKTSVEARSYIKESGHLYDANDTPKPNILQAVKQKILPKQPKRTIPTPTGYKTEEDLKAFREETQKRSLTLGEAQAVGKQLLPLVTPPDSPVFTPQLQQLNDCLTSIYQNGKTVSRNNIERMIQRHADKIVSPEMRQKLYQANNQPQSTGQTHNPPEQSKDKGGREC